jgi:hypothetical protein
VKDKSKQISLRMASVNPLLLSKPAQLLDGIGTVSIRCPHAVNSDISLKIFDTIMRLNLHGIRGISEINLDLHSLTELGIESCGFRRILAWNSRKLLIVVNIHSCRFLISIPSVDDIPFISIKYTPLEELQSNGNHSNFQLFDFPTALLKTQLQAQMTALFQHLQGLELFCYFPLDFTDFCLYQHIPVVSLSHQADGKLPNLPPFYGEKIKLDQFDLSSWSK